MIAYPLSKGSNVVKFYDEGFNDSLAYSIKIVNADFCAPPTVIEIDDISFCNDYVSMSFELPCLEPGDYVMDIYQTIKPTNIIQKLKAVFR